MQIAVSVKQLSLYLMGMLRCLGRQGDLSCFERDMVDVAKLTGMSTAETTEQKYPFSSVKIPRGIGYTKRKMYYKGPNLF